MKPQQESSEEVFAARHRLAAEAHFVERAWERFKLNLTNEDVAELSVRVARGEGVEFDIPGPNHSGKLLEAESQGFLITWGETILPVVYKPGVGCVTVLPPDDNRLRRAAMRAMMRWSRGGR